MTPDRDVAPILVCVRAPVDLGHGTCCLCDRPVVLWADVPARRVVFCVLCFITHADAGTPWTLHPGMLPPC